MYDDEKRLLFQNYIRSTTTITATTTTTTSTITTSNNNNVYLIKCFISKSHSKALYK